MPIIYFEFDHAVVTNLSGGTSTVRSGDITIGYYPMSFNGNEKVELWYKIPDDSDVYSQVWSSMYIENSNFTAYSSTRLINSWSDILSERNWFTSDNSEVTTGTRTQKLSEGSKYFSGGIISFGVDDTAISYEEQHPSTGRYVIMSITREKNYGGYYDYCGVKLPSIENSRLCLYTDIITTKITPVSPIDVAIKKTEINYFTYNVYLNRVSPLHYIESIKLVINVEGNIHEYSAIDSTYRVIGIPANELELGDAVYYISSIDNNGRESTSENVPLVVVGESDAPTITNVTQDALPTITWVSAVQDAWHMIVKDADSVLYDSGMVSGTDKTFTLPMMLSDGSYSIEMRILNRYGHYSTWSAYGFVLETTKPSAPEDIFVSVTNNYGVTIDCAAPNDEGTLYVVRRVPGTTKAEIIGEYHNGFKDFAIPINQTFEYTVRNYNIGYSDGEWIDATVRASGIVVRDGDDLERAVNVWKVEEGEFNLKESNQRDRELVRCVGRTFPVVEISEWISSARSVDVYVDYDSYKIIKDMSLNSNKVYLQSPDEYIPCVLSIVDTSVYMNNGKFVNLTFTRINGD